MLLLELIIGDALNLSIILIFNYFYISITTKYLKILHIFINNLQKKAFQRKNIW